VAVVVVAVFVAAVVETATEKSLSSRLGST
jgi:hypothetical protein